MHLIQALLTFLSVVVFFHLLVIGQSILLPLVIAVFFWFIIHGMERALIRRTGMPKWVALTLSIIIFVATFWIFGSLISDNISRVIEESPKYQANLEALVGNVAAELPFDAQSKLEGVAQDANLGAVLSKTAAAVTGVAGSISIILVYLVFLLVEQGCFANKLCIIAGGKKQQAQLQEILTTIDRKVRSYILVKTATSLMTGLVSYLIMLAVGLDFAVFWALLIFLLNFIPTIGSIIATWFPAIMALVQFPTLAPFVIILSTITVLQIVIGNIVEPKMMGSSLNLSPLVILLSLVLWGSIWGVIGMFLSIPIMVVITIILAEFDRTRPIAVLMSGNGKV
jgi:predicted PurR-regulated permease PerM